MPKDRMRISWIRIESESDPEPQTESESTESESRPNPNPNLPNPNRNLVKPNPKPNPDFRKSDKVIKISKNRYYPSKFLEFHVESQEAIKLRKSRISKKRHFSTCRPPSRPIFGNLTNYQKDFENSILPLKILRISCCVPGGQLN